MPPTRSPTCRTLSRLPGVGRTHRPCPHLQELRIVAPTSRSPGAHVQQLPAHRGGGARGPLPPLPRAAPLAHQRQRGRPPALLRRHAPPRERWQSAGAGEALGRGRTDPAGYTSPAGLAGGARRHGGRTAPRFPAASGSGTGRIAPHRRLGLGQAPRVEPPRSGSASGAACASCSESSTHPARRSGPAM